MCYAGLRVATLQAVLFESFAFLEGFQVRVDEVKVNLSGFYEFCVIAENEITRIFKVEASVVVGFFECAISVVKIFANSFEFIKRLDALLELLTLFGASGARDNDALLKANVSIVIFNTALAARAVEVAIIGHYFPLSRGWHRLRRATPVSRFLVYRVGQRAENSPARFDFFSAGYAPACRACGAFPK